MEIASSILKLPPGMYILRHPKGGLPPLSVTRAPETTGNGGVMEILATDHTHGNVLRDGSDCIVIYIRLAPVELLVAAFLAKAGDPIPSLRVDQIGLDALAAPIAAPAHVPEAIPASHVAPAGREIRIGAQGITVIGHIERNGDMVAAPGEHLGDPASDLRLEGFQVMWPDRPEGVDLAYSIAVEGLGSMPIVKTGKFCGTRGEARRITEVTFALIGPKAGQYRLDGMVHFTGGFQMHVQSGMALSGPSGLEHLTSLSLRAVPVPTQQAQTNPWDDASRTKVFKADSPAKPAVAPKSKSVSTTAKARPKKVSQSGQA